MYPFWSVKNNQYEYNDGRNKNNNIVMMIITVATLDINLT